VYTFRGSSLKPLRNFSEQKSKTKVNSVNFDCLDRRSLTSQVRIVELDVTAAGIIQDLKLGLVGLGDVAEVVLIVGVHGLGVSLALAVAQVVPVRSGKSDLQVSNLVGRDLAGKVLELIDISATNVLDLAGTDDTLTGLVAGLQKCSNIGGVGTEVIHIDIVDLLEAIETGEESTPEH